MADLEYVRVKQTGLGHELTVTKGEFESNPDAYEAVDKDALGPDGFPAPVKYKTSVSAEAAKKAQSGQKAESTKEKS